MKRTAVLVISFLLLAGLAAGCGGGNKNKGVNSGKDMPRPAKGG
jgi:predicted small secreted protein